MRRVPGTVIAILIGWSALCGASADAKSPGPLYVHYSGSASVSYPNGAAASTGGPFTFGHASRSIAWDATATVNLRGPSSGIHLHFSKFSGSTHQDSIGAPDGLRTPPECTAAISEAPGLESKTAEFNWDTVGLGSNKHSVTHLLFLPVWLSNLAQSDAPADSPCAISPMSLPSSWFAPAHPFCPNNDLGDAAYAKAIAPDITIKANGSTSVPFNFSYHDPCLGSPLDVQIKSVLAASYTKKHTAPANHKPDKKNPKPKKKKGIDIVDVTTGKTVTHDEVKTVTGELSHFRVVNKDGSKASDPRWSVPGADRDPSRARVIKDYKVTPTSADPDGLRAGDLNDATVRMYVVRPGVERVSVRASGKQTWVDVAVQAPVVDPNPAVMCQTGVGTISHDPRISGSILGLGFTDGACESTPGIQWNWIVHAPEGGAGHIAMTQLFTRVVKHKSTGLRPDPLTECDNLTNHQQQADDSSFYDQRHKPASIWKPSIASGGTAAWKDTDSPHIPLRTRPGLLTDTWIESFDADDYLMYRPATVDSIWVPIASLDWSWDGTASFRVPLTTWMLDKGAISGPAFAAGVPRFLPDWSRAIVGGQSSGCTT